MAGDLPATISSSGSAVLSYVVDKSKSNLAGIAG